MPTGQRDPQAGRLDQPTAVRMRAWLEADLDGPDQGLVQAAIRGDHGQARGRTVEMRRRGRESPTMGADPVVSAQRSAAGSTSSGTARPRGRGALVAEFAVERAQVGLAGVVLVPARGVRRPADKAGDADQHDGSGHDRAPGRPAQPRVRAGASRDRCRRARWMRSADEGQGGQSQAQHQRADRVGLEPVREADLGSEDGCPTGGDEQHLHREVADQQHPRPEGADSLQDAVGGEQRRGDHCGHHQPGGRGRPGAARMPLPAPRPPQGADDRRTRPCSTPEGARPWACCP